MTMRPKSRFARQETRDTKGERTLSVVFGSGDLGGSDKLFRTLTPAHCFTQLPVLTYGETAINISGPAVHINLGQ